MVTAKGCNLGQVGDGDNLTFLVSHLLHHLSHLLGNLSTNSRINLVEDDGRQFHSSADKCLQREHDTRNLTTRGHLRYRLEWGRGVGRKEEADVVLSVLVELASSDSHFEAHMRHA